ncbi:hypothetical protein N1030_10745 [Desulfovibrio mangrovi]|uniref:hypothetical protein n=1 Tax=Desulfovibrio mangrovi TaxID=2976983 RepID=UPI002245AE7B|nr:hypothetical protein [Desulfovibrio mangrovi]UZP66101.1 hypothetical protein N1030_10745 [Desulfovibrio mangrovi]
MDLTSLYLAADAILIAPYRWFASATAGMWAGTSILSIWAIIAGELALTLIYLTNRSYYASLNTKMVKMHNLSIEAIQCKDKESFKATNKWANEYFGKMFFSHAALFAVSIWPLPFALGWMQTRFEGITIHTVPYFETPLGYQFVMLTCYILLRLAFSKVRAHVPLLRRVDRMRKEDSNSAGKMRSWAELGASAQRVGTERTLVLSPVGNTVIETSSPAIAPEAS